MFRQLHKRVSRLSAPLWLLLLGLIPASLSARDFTYTYEGQTLTYTVIDEEAKTVETKQGQSEDGGNKVSGDIILPSIVYDGETSYTLTKIGGWGFESNKDLTSIKLPNTITEISNSAFGYCSGLTNIEIPTSVSTIGNYAFYRCSGLTSIIIPNSVTSIGYGAFSDCSGLTDIEIPTSVSTIGWKTFYNCTGLTSVTIPNSVTSIDEYAFYGCRGLTSVTIPNSVTSINNYTFYDCRKLTSVTIPNSVTSIGYAAFYDCRKLTSVIIPNSVTSIGDDAFKYCKGLQKSAYPSSLSNPFPTGVAVSYPAEDSYIEDGCIWSEDKTKLYFVSIDLKGEFTIPNSVTSIGYAVFYNCSGLTSITIPNSVTSIGNSAFRNCIGLKSVKIPNSVTSIGDDAFIYCSGLTSMIIPNSVTSIGRNAFTDCVGLKKSAYPSSLSKPFSYGVAVSYPAEGSYIEDGYIWSEDRTCLYFVPYNVTGEFTIPNSVTLIGNDAFSGCNALTSVIIPNSVTSIGNSAFSRCNALTSVIIPNSVTSIDQNAFSDCSGLKKSAYPSSLSNPFPTGVAVSYPAKGSCIENGYIWNEDKTDLYFVPLNVEGVFTLPKSVTTIGGMAFYGCDDITGLTVESSVPASFNDNSFSNYNIEVTVPTGSLYDYAASDWAKFPTLKDTSGVTSVEFSDDVFKFRVISQDEVMLIAGNYNNMASVSIPERVVCDDKFKYVTVIGSSAFSDCNYMTSLVLPKRLKSISESAFSGCTGLTTVNFPESLTTIGNSSFSGCTRLTTVNFQESLTTIGNKSFYGCTGLTTVNFPKSLTTIGNSSFSDCTGLTEFTLNGNIESIGDYAFSNCRNLLTFNSKDIASVGEGAFKNCKKLEAVTINWEEIAKETFSNCDGLKFPSIASALKSIGDGAFYKCVSLFDVFIPGSVNSIGDQAFYGCEKLESIFFDKGEASIGNQAFYNCKNLKSLILAEGMASIGNQAFYGCSSLPEVYIPGSVSSIGQSAFYGCSNLSEVSIPASVNSIGESAFENCSMMGKFTLEDAIEPIKIGDNALYLTPIKDMYIGRDYTYNGYGSMSTGIESLTYGNAITTIPAYAFNRAYGLKTVNFGSSIETIGENAFNGCALTELVLPPHVKTIGNNAFSANNIKNIAIGSEVTEIGEKAFDGANQLAGVSITATTPPMANNNTFSYYDCPLYVTPGYVDTYYNFTRCWYRFTGHDLIPAEKVTIQTESGNMANITLKPGETMKLSATMTPANASLPYIFWRSTNPAFATVDQEGNVTLVNRNEDDEIATYADGAATECKILAETLYATCPVAEITIKDATSGIEDIITDEDENDVINRPNDIYNLQGICLKRNATEDDIKALRPGLYIIAGKKVIIR